MLAIVESKPIRPFHPIILDEDDLNCLIASTTRESDELLPPSLEMFETVLQKKNENTFALADGIDQDNLKQQLEALNTSEEVRERFWTIFD